MFLFYYIFGYNATVNLDFFAQYRNFMIYKK